MDIEYLKFDPTGNITILVKSPTPRIKQQMTAARLMALEPDTEQIGFIEAPENSDAAVRLQMAGGEFCGNATMSLAAHLAADSGLNTGETADFEIEVSGADDLIHCSAKNVGGKFFCTVTMPLPEGITEETYVSRSGTVTLPTVHLPGVTHVICPVGSSNDYRSLAEGSIAGWAELSGSEALGIMFYNETAGTVTPLVCVPDSGTIVWEHGCCSGTAALGAYLAARDRQSIKGDFLHPSGIMSVSAEYASGAVSNIFVSGYVTQIK